MAELERKVNLLKTAIIDSGRLYHAQFEKRGGSSPGC